MSPRHVLEGIPDLLIIPKSLIQLHHDTHLLVVTILGQTSGDAQEKLLVAGLKHGGQGLLGQAGALDLVGRPVLLLVGEAAVKHTLAACTLVRGRG